MSDYDYSDYARPDATQWQEAQAELTRLRALLFDVASAGIEYSARDYVVIQLPLVTWDALEQAAQEKP